ncbi:MAG: phosphate ABC transporter substrate-binding protein [Cellvibrionaceae bacterium]
MKKLIKNTVLSCVAALVSTVLLPSITFAESVSVVVSAKSSVDSLTENDVKRIFLAKRDDFPNGDPAIPLDQEEGSSAFEAFYRNVVKKSSDQLQAYRSRLVFTGKGQPPKQMAANEIEKLVAQNPSVIGYITGDVTSAGVKVVFKK